MSKKRRGLFQVFKSNNENKMNKNQQLQLQQSASRLGNQQLQSQQLLQKQLDDIQQQNHQSGLKKQTKESNTKILTKQNYDHINLLELNSSKSQQQNSKSAQNQYSVYTFKQKQYRINIKSSNNEEIKENNLPSSNEQSVRQIISSNGINIQTNRQAYTNSLIDFDIKEYRTSYEQKQQQSIKEYVQEEIISEEQQNKIILQKKQSLNSSQNIFQKMRKKQKQNKMASSQQTLQENIFDKYKKIEKQKKQNQQSSDSQSDNIFQKKRPQQKIGLGKSYQGNSYSLQHILQSSDFYNSLFFNNKKTKLQSLPSLHIPQLHKNQSKSKKFFFKPDRLQFKRSSVQPFVESIHNSNNFLCKLTRDRNTFYFQDLKDNQSYKLNGFKCSKITFEQSDKIGRHIQYDHINQRFYIFSNKQQKLLIYSSTSYQLLCKVQISKNIMDPILHFYHMNNRSFLMIIGGYGKTQKSRVTGSKYLQIYQLNKWQVIFKSKLIKLIVGRINPIILSNQTNLIIIGGNSLAEVDKQGKLNFNYQQAINQSTNMTGIVISTQQISQLFDYQEQVNVQNISVKINNPHILHSGIVISYQSTFLLILPNAKNLFYIKIFNKEVNIIQTNKMIDVQTKTMKEQYQKRQLTLKVDHNNLIIYRITSEGMLRLIRCQQKKKQICCNIY